MPISFNEVPTNIRVPFVYVEFDASRAVQGPALMPYKVLVVGQRLAAGTVAELAPTRVTNASQAAEYFGAGSILAQMLAAHFQQNELTETWAVALDDLGAGTAAVGAVQFGGAPAAGTLSLYIGGRRIRVGVAAGDTGTEVAAALVAEIATLPDVPVTAAVNGVDDTIVDLTARHKGEAGNDIDIRANYFGESLPTGLTVTVTPMATGAGNPDIEEIWPVLGDEHFNIIAMPWTDAANLTALETELADRWGPLRQIEGLAFAAATGSHSELVTLGDSRNSKHLSIMNAAGSPSLTWEWAAAVASVAAYYGNIDPARPFQTLALDGIKAPAIVDRFTLAENNLLLYDGIATHMVDAGGTVLIQRLVTTYQENPQGAEDIAYLDVNTPLTLAYLRYDFRNLILRKYPRHKLAGDDARFGPGQAVITPKVGRAEAIARFRIWEEIGLVEGIDQFKRDLIVERNIADPNRLDFLLPPDLVNQFRVAGVQIGFLL